MTAIQITREDMGRDPAAVRAWLEAHGLIADRVAPDPGPVIRDGRIRATLVVPGPLGVTLDVSIPLRVPLPDGFGQVIP